MNHLNKTTLKKDTKMKNLQVALKNVPAIKSYQWDASTIDMVECFELPVITITKSDFNNCLAILTSEAGEKNDCAFIYDDFGMCEIVDVCEPLKAWAKKYGFYFECLWSGTYGLYEA